MTSKPQLNLYPKGSINAALTISVKFEPGLSMAKIIKASLLTEVGFIVNAIIVDFDTKEILNATKVNDVHICDWGTCFEGDVKIFISIKIEGKIFGKTIGNVTLKPKATLKLFDYHLRTKPSIDFNMGKCPNIAYRCDITVVNKDGKPISNVDISSDSVDISDYYKYNVKNATNDQGCVSFFYKKGDYTPTLYLNGTAVAADKLRQKVFGKLVDSQTFRIIGEVKSVTFVIDTDVTDGGGSGHNQGGGATEWFSHTATFDANGGKFADGSTSISLTVKSGDIITPPSPPKKSGYIFTSWSPEIPDVMPNKDITFIAKYSKGDTGYSLSGETLTISGSGNMTNFTNYISGQPWASLRQTVKKIVVEPGVTSIGDNAFYQFVKLESVSIPDTVTYIGDGAFYECNLLQKIELPDSVVTIAPYAFYGCDSLKTVLLGSVQTIGAEAFCLCSSLEKVVVPETCLGIGEKAFDLCYSLKRIDFENKDCVIYDGASTIYSGAKIYGYTDSSAYDYAKKYGRSFAKLSKTNLYTQAVIDTTEIYDSYAVTYSSCVAGSDYILLNVTGYGAGFELTTSNLEYIDQLTADASGKVSSKFIPRNFVSGSTTLLIGDFGNGVETKIVTPNIVSTSVEIVDNPGTLTINYMEGIRLYAEIISPVDGCDIQWYVNGTAYTMGDTIEIEHLKGQTEITVKLVDANGNPVIKNGEEITAEETINVKAGFFQKIIAFFKFTLFGQVVLKTN